MSACFPGLGYEYLNDAGRKKLDMPSVGVSVLGGLAPGDKVATHMSMKRRPAALASIFCNSVTHLISVCMHDE